MKGCLGYDCLGAGQFAVQKNVPANQDMFAVYRKLFSLHQMLWYLGEALLQKETASFHGELQMLIQTLDTVRRQPWKTVLTADIDSLHEQTNRLLKKTMQQKQLRHPSPHKHPMGKRFTNKRLRSTDFSMKSLLAADLSGCDLQGSCFLGSDMRDCRIAAGTADFTKGPAMSRAEAVQAVGEGIALARELAEDGYRLIATGEMGIGNTTTSSAVAAVLLGQPVELMTGRGAGLSDEGLARKVDAICRGILKNEPDPEDPLDVLSKLGGFDIAGLCGIFLGGALAGVPVLADGFISGVAALCAVRLCPAAAKAVFASHCSAEPAARIVLEALGKAPIITAGLHLGEGTGAVASIPLWDMALAVYGGCYSFAEGGIAPYTPQC